MQALKLGVYTIPHTGTRFVTSFLKECGIEHNQRHVASPRTVPEWRRILTVRHPYDCYLTRKHRMPSESDESFIAMWGHYIWRTQWMDAFYVALDIPEENRRGMMQMLMTFCNETPDFDVIDPWCEAWKPVGESDRDRDEMIPEHMVAPLAFACEWYRHYTLNFGPYYRDSRNMLGEGP